MSPAQVKSVQVCLSELLSARESSICDEAWFILPLSVKEKMCRLCLVWAERCRDGEERCLKWKQRGSETQNEDMGQIWDQLEKEAIRRCGDGQSFPSLIRRNLQRAQSMMWTRNPALPSRKQQY